MFYVYMSLDCYLAFLGQGLAFFHEDWMATLLELLLPVAVWQIDSWLLHFLNPSHAKPGVIMHPDLLFNAFLYFWVFLVKI